MNYSVFTNKVFGVICANSYFFIRVIQVIPKWSHLKQSIENAWHLQWFSVDVDHMVVLVEFRGRVTSHRAG